MFFFFGRARVEFQEPKVSKKNTKKTRADFHNTIKNQHQNHIKKPPKLSEHSDPISLHFILNAFIWVVQKSKLP